MSQLILCIACFSHTHQMDNSLADLVNSNSPPYQFIYLLNNQSTVDLQQIIANFHYPIIIGGDKFDNINADLWYPGIIQAFVLVFCDNLRNCVGVISNQIARHAFNPRQKVLMEVVRSVSGNANAIQMILQDVFQSCRKINLLNVVIRFQLDGDGNWQSFSYNPFEETFLINLTDSAEVQFYSNKVKNMNGHPFRMSVFESPPYLVNSSKSDGEWFGYDGGMLRSIAKHFNASLKLVVPVNLDPGYEIYINSSSIQLTPGATKDVVDNRSDIVINTRPFTPSYLIEQLYPYYFNPVSIFLPKATIMSWTTALVEEFMFNTKVTFICTLFLVLLINRLFHKRRESTSGSTSILEIFSYFLLISYLPTGKYRNIHRFFLVTWSIFCLIFVSLITGIMYSHLVVVRYKDDVNTIAQLMATEYQVPITHQRYSLFELYNRDNTKEMLSEQYWNLMPKFVVFETRQEIFDMIERNKRYAFMQTNGHCEYFVSKKRFENDLGGPIYHLMEENVVPDNAVQIVQYGSPYFDELNTLLLWFKEAGLDKYSRMRLDMQLEPDNSKASTETSGLSVTKLSHVFTIYGLGIGICVLVFIFELLWWHSLGRFSMSV